MVRRRSLLSLTLAAACGSLGACGAPPAVAAGGQLVQVQVVDRAFGDVLREVRHRGTTWVAGRPGDRYAVRLTNRTGGRLLVVLSVDGVNAVSGQTAATSQTGYVLAPWQSADITGWRKSATEAAAFFFTALPDSYAARTDRPENVGVIGVAAFRERAPVPRPEPFEVAPSASSRRDGAERRADAGPAAAPSAGGAAGHPAGGTTDAAEGPGGRPAAARAQAERAEAPTGANRMTSRPPMPAPAAPAAAAPAAPEAAAPPARAERLGTGHGEREYAPVTRTSFERATPHAAEIVQIRYDSHANLVAAGILPPPQHAVPHPFPGYVPDPR